MPTLITIASDSTTLPSRSPNCVSLIRYSPIAPDTTANENIVFAKSYRVQAPWATGRRFGSRAPSARSADAAGTVGAVIVTPARARLTGAASVAGRAADHSDRASRRSSIRGMVVDELAGSRLAADWRPAAARRAAGRATSPTRSSSPTGAGARVVAALTEDRGGALPRRRGGRRPRGHAPGAARRVHGVDASSRGTSRPPRCGPARGPSRSATKVERPPILRAARSSGPGQGRPVRPRPGPRGRGRRSWSRVTIEAARARRAARLRGDRPAVARRPGDRRRPAAGAQAAARGRPRRVVPRARVGVRAAIGRDDARVVGHARLRRAVLSRASNSRYLAGRINEDWAIAKAPTSASPMPQPTPPR